MLNHSCYLTVPDLSAGVPLTGITHVLQGLSCSFIFLQILSNHEIPRGGTIYSINSLARQVKGSIKR